MNIDEIADFLETETISFTFTDLGLKYLSLKTMDGEETIKLREFNINREANASKKLIIEETINFFNNGSHSMPLDLTSFTSFQKAVFKAVLKIPPREIYTYKEVAIMIENPDAARAVGNALSKSPFAYFMPAHRVLPKRGIGRCKSGAGFLRCKLLELEGHDLEKLNSE